MPLPLEISLVIVLVVLTIWLGGMTSGLMSLDPSELALIIKSGRVEINRNRFLLIAGTKAERRYANIILPIRKSGNYLLCTLLFGNVMVNCAISILMADLSANNFWNFMSIVVVIVFTDISGKIIVSRCAAF